MIAIDFHSSRIAFTGTVIGQWTTCYDENNFQIYSELHLRNIFTSEIKLLQKVHIVINCNIHNSVLLRAKRCSNKIVFIFNIIVRRPTRYILWTWKMFMDHKLRRIELPIITVSALNSYGMSHTFHLHKIAGDHGLIYSLELIKGIKHYFITFPL